MKTYELRAGRPKTGDGFFKRLHLGLFPEDVANYPRKRGLVKTRWLRGIGAHLQQAITRAVSDRAKGQKRTGRIPLSNIAVVSALEKLGIGRKWTACPDLMQLLELDISVVKDAYVKRATRLEFKLSGIICHYFDGDNRARQTAEAHSLRFRLLKQTPQLFDTN